MKRTNRIKALYLLSLCIVFSFFPLNALTLNKTSQELRSLIGDTVSFDFGLKNDDFSILYMNRIDTVWKKKIKDKSKAQKFKHFEIKETPLTISQIENLEYKIVEVKNRNNISSYNNPDVNVYLESINTQIPIQLLWKYDSEQSVKIKVKRKILELATEFKNNPIIYIIDPYTNKYYTNDHRAYKRTSYKDNIFYYGTYMIPHAILEVEDEAGMQYKVERDKILTESEYNKLKNETLSRLKKDGNYTFQLSKVEKSIKSNKDEGTLKTLPSTGNSVPSNFEDNNISILWDNTFDKFLFKLKNKSDETIKIIWDEAIFVDENNNSGKIIHKGIPESRAHESQKPTMVAGNGEIEEIIIPVERIDKTPNTIIPRIRLNREALNNKSIKIILPIEKRGKINEYIFIFDIIWKYDHPELQDFD